jgi:predicted kinase
MSGLPGSGKSTLADGLAAALACTLFSVDPIESALLRSGLKKSVEMGLAAYLVAEVLADEHLRRGLSVVVDAVNAVEEAREMWRNLAHRRGVALRVVECVVAEDVHQQRIRARVRSLYGIPEVTWQDVEERRKIYVPWTEERLVLDTAAPQAENLQRALDYIHSTTRHA